MGFYGLQLISTPQGFVLLRISASVGLCKITDDAVLTPHFSDV